MAVKSDCLQWTKPEKIYGASILRIASIFAFVRWEEKIADVADALLEHSEVMAFAVLGKDNAPMGLVSRLHFFGLLGKPFGREILSKRKIEELAEKVPTFDSHADLFHVAAEVTPSISDQQTTYFLLTDNRGRYQGIFSSFNVMMYLSQITQDDIQLAGELQARMVKPLEEWSGKGWQAQAFSQTAKGVGGDFYFHTQLSEGRSFFALGDVAGKGVAASILTSLLWGTLKTYDFHRGMTPLLMHLNQALIQTFQLEKYLTGVFAMWDEQRHTLGIADMGHGHIGVIRRGKVLRVALPHSNLPLGIELNINPRLYRLHLRKGDTFVAYTDGLLEQENAQGVEFGEGALRKVLHKDRANPTAHPESLQAAIAQWRGPLPQLDDITWLQLTVLGD